MERMFRVKENCVKRQDKKAGVYLGKKDQFPLD